MAGEAASPSVALPESVALPDIPGSSFPLPPGTITADASAASLPITPLAPVKMSSIPEPSRLLRAAHATLAFLAHPYPRRATRPPLGREEHLSLAQNEAARLERERQSYRTMGLGIPMR